jgi:hypothetical protein
MGQKIESTVILVCLKDQTISDRTLNISRQVASKERISRLPTFRHQKAFTKYVWSVIFTGKAKSIDWSAINLMLKYFDMFLEGCRMTNVAT